MPKDFKRLFVREVDYAELLSRFGDGSARDSGMGEMVRLGVERLRMLEARVAELEGLLALLGRDALSDVECKRLAVERLDVSVANLKMAFGIGS